MSWRLECSTHPGSCRGLFQTLKGMNATMTRQPLAPALGYSTRCSSPLFTHLVPRLSLLMQFQSETNNKKTVLPPLQLSAPKIYFYREISFELNLEKLQIFKY